MNPSGKLEEKREFIHEILQHGCKIAKTEGVETLEEVKEAMHLKYF